MSILDIQKAAREDDSCIGQLSGEKLFHPKLSPAHYSEQVASDPYFRALVYLRHHLRAVSDEYFSREIGAKNVDLFMMTSSVSSPAGRGSDSEPIPLSFGGLQTYLVDSSQFGFEPILVNGIPRAYCYLASLRGENPDARHLNQFYHCEYEACEIFEETMKIAEGYVRTLVELIRAMPHTIERMSTDPAKTKQAINAILSAKKFPQITFDEAVRMLKQENNSSLLRTSLSGEDITPEGERVLLRILKAETPIWVTHYLRDHVPFYQKPLKNNSDRVLNADLLCPALSENGFAGEILGMGQRQDSAEELYESIKRQGIDPNPYEWYIALRRMPAYKTTSGFGLGIERFISYIFGFDSIYKGILYPRMKGITMNP